jgi:NAD(P)-dependent dehydrogenase (short-subunit alcohol dehydrogenase family)
MAGTLALTGRVALVTGASRGIGRAIALALGAAGAAVACCARSAEQVETTAAEVGRRGGRARGFRLDVTRREQVDAVVAAAGDALGPVDILVNNAGITRDKRSVEVTDQEWTTSAKPHLDVRAGARSADDGQRHGRSSTSADVRQDRRPRYAACCASKAAWRALTPGLAVGGAPPSTASLRRQHGHPAGGHGRRSSDALSVRVPAVGSASGRRSPRSPSIWLRRPRLHDGKPSISTRPDHRG